MLKAKETKRDHAWHAKLCLQFGFPLDAWKVDSLNALLGEQVWGLSLKILALTSQCLQAKAHIERGKRKEKIRKENSTHKISIFVSSRTLPLLSFQKGTHIYIYIYSMELFPVNDTNCKKLASGWWLGQGIWRKWLSNRSNLLVFCLHIIPISP